MRKTIVFGMAMLLSLVFFSCSDDDGGGDSLEVNPSVLRFGEEGEQLLLKVASNRALTEIRAHSEADWVIAEPSVQGDGFLVSVPENETSSPRSAVLQIVAGNQAREVDIFQAGADLLELTSETGKCWDLNIQLLFGVKTKKAWTATAAGSWFKLEKSSGQGNDIVRIILEKNTSLSDRSGEVKVKAGDVEKTFTFTQSGAVEDLGRKGDSLALVAIYKTMHGGEGGPWGGQFSQWMEGPIHKWFGVFCNAEGRVRQLILTTLNQAYGERFPEEMKYLTGLEVFLYNPRPTVIGDDVKDFNDKAHYYGEIPFALARCTRLRQVDILNCEFRDVQLPSWWGCLPQLQTLTITHDRSDVTGTLTGELPWELAGCSQLSGLHINAYGVTGELPALYADYLYNLQWVSLNGNKLSGKIPEAYGELSLKSLELVNNEEMFGEIPAKMCERIYAEELSLMIKGTSIVECDN